MRYGIFSDVHGNWEAFNAVQDIFLRERVDKYVCCGDVVGYGANPKECMERVLELDCLWIAGDSDYAAAGKLSIEFWGPSACQHILFSRNALSCKFLKHLANLDLVQKKNNCFTIVHGSLDFPELFNYIMDKKDALISLKILETPLCFYGHLHVPSIYLENQKIAFLMNNEVNVDLNQKMLVNVGSVGQPRDGNPLASCCVYDDELQKVWIHRVEYDIDTAVEKMMHAGLPEILAKRLYYGK